MLSESWLHWSVLLLTCSPASGSSGKTQVKSQALAESPGIYSHALGCLLVFPEGTPSALYVLTWMLVQTGRVCPTNENQIALPYCSTFLDSIFLPVCTFPIFSLSCPLSPSLNVTHGLLIRHAASLLIHVVR